MSSKIQKKEVLNKLAETLSQMLKIPKERIKLESDLENELGIDSLDFFDVLVRIGESFDLKVSTDEELPIFKTVSDIVEFIENKVSNL